jgi:hypothetical protein
MEKHKSNALEGKCLCGECPHKFECFTQERIFSDSIFQGLFEALIAQGSSKDDALKRVIGELEARIRALSTNTWTISNPYTVGGASSTPVTYKQPQYTTGTYWGIGATSNVTLTDCTKGSSNYTITYSMIDGEEISWNACCDRIYQSR